MAVLVGRAHPTPVHACDDGRVTDRYHGGAPVYVALGIDRSWYEVPAAQENSQRIAIPP